MPKKTRGLARGLDALLPEMDTIAPGAGQEIAIGDIDPNPDQPRHTFAEEAIAQLAQSIRDQGVLQPILVVPVRGGRYRIVAGERRWRAARAAGMNTVTFENDYNYFTATSMGITGMDVVDMSLESPTRVVLTARDWGMVLEGEPLP